MDGNALVASARELSEEEEKFVEQYARTGNAGAAAFLAGITSDRKRAEERGKTILDKPHIRAALRVAVSRKLENAAFIAVNVVVEVLTDKTANNKDRLNAAGMILDRGSGTSKITRQDRNVQIDVHGPADLINELWRRREANEKKAVSKVIDAKVIEVATEVVDNVGPDEAEVADEDVDPFEGALDGK